MNDSQSLLAARVLSLLDLTELSDGCREDLVEALLQKALGPYGPPAAVCIWPQFVEIAARRLAGKPIRIATVINFPKGGTHVDRAVDDTVEALDDGANEIDLVLPYRAFLSGDKQIATDMVAAVSECLSPEHRLKVILETGEYPDQTAIADASRLAIAGGAHFIKTSTGKSAVSATPEAVTTMLGVIHETPAAVGLKPSGGIRTLADAKLYLDLAAGIMGDGWATPATFRFGASGLHTAIIEALGATRKEADPDGVY
jgi:deoxyribose-phosphate aldolase